MSPIRQAFAFAAAVVAMSTAPLVYVAPASAHPTVDIAVANWKFTPAKIQAHVGEQMTLRFTSSEGVHGVESADLGIPKTTIPPGKVTEVSFTPKKAGTYVIHCAILCGDGHDKMTLTVEVQS